MKEDDIKLIFGLKLNQLRTERGFSLSELAKKTGLSKSYLNEIENGKKYPKPDKIVILAEQLESSYDDLVSLQLDKNLAPIGELLRSKVLKELPLELFGIKESDLIEIVANAPLKVNAFISTIIEIAQHYSFSRESFYLASVRSHQEANDNYFQDLETQSLACAKELGIDLDAPLQTHALQAALEQKLGYTLRENELAKHSDLGELRSVFVPSSKSLLLAEGMDEAQRAFIFAKELAYHYLQINERLFTFPWIRFETFDQVLNNFYASYFAGALLLPKQKLVRQMSEIFAKKTFDLELFEKAMSEHNASPESFYQRLTNLLPHAFNIRNLFFLRFTHPQSSSVYLLNKELHLNHQHAPRANERNEHYCRRWVSLRVLQSIEKSGKSQVTDVQISNYRQDKVSYLVISTATKDPFKENQFRSISIGLRLNASLKRKLKFLNDSGITEKEVNVTCERCGIADCKLREAPPIILEESERNQKIQGLVAKIHQDFAE